MAAYPDWETIGAPATATVGASAAVIAAIPARANAVLIGSSANNAFITLEGTTPTATKGIQLVADAEPLLLPLSSRGSALKGIREGSDATVQYQFVRVRRNNWR